MDVLSNGFSFRGAREVGGERWKLGGGKVGGVKNKDRRQIFIALVSRPFPPNPRPETRNPKLSLKGLTKRIPRK
jgi:hypothetical protein